MATTIAAVKVSRIEAGAGWCVTCPTCTWRTLRPFRQEADRLAADHQRRHTTPDPVDHASA